jgi:hypothetical protein
VDVPAEAADVARDTLGAAAEVARQLPDGLGIRLIDAARDSFLQGLHLSAGIAAASRTTGTSSRDVTGRPDPPFRLAGREGPMSPSTPRLRR